MMIPHVPIVPQIAAFTPDKDRCEIGRGLVLSEDPAQSPPEVFADQVRSWIRGHAPSAMHPDIPVLSFRLVDASDPNGQGHPHEEAYKLTVASHGIIAEASSITGLFYAFQSVRQLVNACHGRHGGRLRAGVIEDRPRFLWRGAMLDSARHFQPVPRIKRFLDVMASLKLNRFHWHLTDDEGWRAEIRSHPELTEVGGWRDEGDRRYGGYYTQEQMREVVAYARARSIVVIPEIEMPGHCNAALAAYPELSCKGDSIAIQAPTKTPNEPGRVKRRAFCAAREEVYELVADVFRELAEVFDAPHLHIGGDETPREEWQHCPRCQELMRREGYETTDELRTHFLRRIHADVRQRTGRTTIAWTERVRDDLPEDQITHAWFPGEAAASARLGRRTINSNHEWTYLDYPINSAMAKDRPDWMILLPLEKAYHFDPLPDGLEERDHHLLLGSEAPIWTEFLPDERALYEQVMPRLAALAEVFWSPRMGRTYEGFLERWDVVGPTVITPEDGVSGDPEAQQVHLRDTRGLLKLRSAEPRAIPT